MAAARITVWLLCAQAALAQGVMGARAGTVNFTVGAVTVDGQAVSVNPTTFPLLKDGQALETGDGLAELLLGPGVFLRLGLASALRMADTRLSDTQVVLLKGTALVEVVNQTKGDRIQIQFGNTRTGFKNPGLYRFEVDKERLRVFGGEAEVQADGLRVEAGRGKQVRLEPGLAISKFNPKQKDRLHRWAARRSFELFASSREARRRETHWEMTASGWSWNRDFGVRFFSKKVVNDYEATHPPQSQRF